jgi:cation diffusion facilitator family transporter
VNLAAALLALAMITVALRPPDEEHAFGHGKAEYVASGAEGALILVAAVGIGWAAVGRLLHPQALEKIGLGVLVSAAASGVNLAVARVLIGVGRRRRSIALEADGHHLMTDVWTSVGVLVGIGGVAATGWPWLDPAIALAVAAQIVWSGFLLMRRSWLGILDSVLPAEDREALDAVLARHCAAAGVRFHAVRTRQAGARRFVSMHVLVPGDWSVSRGHALAEAIERDVGEAIPGAAVDTHLEAIEDPASYEDQDLDRGLPHRSGSS